MSSSTASQPSTQSHHFAIELHQVAKLGTGYHLQNTPGQLQRQNVIDRARGELCIIADITHIIHGHLHANGPPATLCVFQFRFSGSQLQGRRFRMAIAQIGFAHGTKGDVGASQFDPEVLQISPDGEFVWDHTIASGQDEKGVSISTGGLGGIALPFAPELSVSWSVSKEVTHEGQVSLSGSRNVCGRNSGARNSARWRMRENALRGSGVPSILTTAVLVKPHVKSAGVFRAIVNVDVEVDTAYKVGSAVKFMSGKTMVDPVVFQHGLAPVGPQIEGLDVNNLGKVGDSGILKRLGFVNAL